IYTYLDQFGIGDPKAFLVLRSDVALRQLCLANADPSEMESRFPFLELYPTKLVAPNAKGSLLSFAKNFRSCYIDNCVLLNRKENIFRCKDIQSAMIIANRVTKREILDALEDIAEGQLKGERLWLQGAASERAVAFRGMRAVDDDRVESLLIAASL